MRTVLFFLLFAAFSPAGEPPAFREAVPEGALLRLGTTRFRANAPILRLFYTKDDRVIVGCTAAGIVVWDADSGAKVKDIPFSADLRHDPDEEGDFDNNGIPLLGSSAYDAARDRIACFRRNAGKLELQYWDVKAGRKAFAVEDAAPRCALEWTPDGRLVTVNRSQAGNTTVLVRDGAGAQLHRWTMNDAGNGYRNPEFRLLDDDRLILVGGEGRPAIYRLKDGEELVKMGDGNAADHYALLAASRDGKLVAVGSRPNCDIYEAATGKKVAGIPGDDQSPGRKILFSPDGKTIYYNTLEKEGFDIASGKPCFDIRLNHASGGMVDGISHDGKRVLCHNLGSPVLYQIAASTGKEIAPPPGHEPGARLVWMPDGKAVLARAPNENTWTVWNLRDGRRERQFAIVDPKGNGYYPNAPIRVSADGRELVDLNAGGLFENASVVFDTATGAVRRKLFDKGHALNAFDRFAFGGGEPNRVLACDSDRENATRRYVFTWWNLATDARESGFGLDLHSYDSLSSVGPYIAVAPISGVQSIADQNNADPHPYPHAVRLLRAANGRRFRTLEHGADLFPSCICASADSELLLTSSATALLLEANQRPAGPFAPQKFYWHLWEVATGKEIARWPKPQEDTPALLEPRGRYAVQATGPAGFAVWEPYVSKRAIAEVAVPAPVESFSFSPDGRRLAAVLKDTTIVIWDTAPWDAAIARVLAVARPADEKALVAGLAGPPDTANAAARLLASAGDGTVALLKGEILPAKAGDAAQLRKLIADLDSPRFIVRERASKQLAGLGFRAETALRAASGAKPNAEVQSRLDKLLAQLEAPEYDAETLRGLRAVRVLRDIGTPAARELLAEWAKGDGGAPMTRAALGK